MGFGDRLRKVLDFKNVSAYKVARDINVSVNTIQRYLKGEGIPNGGKMIVLTSYLGISADWLLNGVGEMKISESDFIPAVKEADTSFFGFKDRLNEVIDIVGVTSYKISKDTGIANTTLSTYRNRDVKPNIANAKILAEYLGISPDWLLYDAGEMRANDNDHLLVDSDNVEDTVAIERDDSRDAANTKVLEQRIEELERVIAFKDEMIKMKDEMILSLRDTIELLKRGQ